MKYLLGLIAMILVASRATAQNIPTNEELAQLNKRAIAVNTTQIAAVEQRLNALEQKCEDNACVCNRVSTAAAPQKGVGVLDDTADLDDTIDKLSKLVKVAELTEKLQTTSRAPVVSTPAPQIVSISQPVVRSRTVSSRVLGTPKIINGVLRACTDPNCTDPTCPNRQVSFSGVRSSPVSYTSSWSTPTRSVRTRTKVCDEYGCRYVYD